MAYDDVVWVPIRDSDDGRNRVVAMPVSYTTPGERSDVGTLMNYIQNYRNGRYTPREFDFRVAQLSGASIGGYELETNADELVELMDEGKLDIGDDIYDDSSRFSA